MKVRSGKFAGKTEGQARFSQTCSGSHFELFCQSVLLYLPFCIFIQRSSVAFQSRLGWCGFKNKKTRSARKLILAFRQYEILISLSVFGVVCLRCLLEAEFKFTHPPGNQSLGRSVCKCCLSSLSLQILPQVFPQVQPELSKERRKPTRHEEISGKNVCSPSFSSSLSLFAHVFSGQNV